MSTFLRYGKPVQTVFDLLGTLENDITDSFAYTLSKSDAFAALVLNDLGIRDRPQVAMQIGVQNHRPGFGVTDLELEGGNHYFIIVEAKSGSALPTYEQLSAYAALLEWHPAARKVLVALTNASQHAANLTISLMPDTGVHLVHRSWREVRELAVAARRQEASSRTKAILGDFVDYLGGILGMENRFSNLAYVVSLGAGSPDGWSLSWIDIVVKRDRYFYPVGKNWPSPPPNYIAFRYGGRLQSIHHVEDFIVIENFRHVFPEAPDTPIEPHYCLTLGPAIRPLHEVKAGPRIVRAGRAWCMIDTLLTSETISQALDETEKRNSAQ